MLLAACADAPADTPSPTPDLRPASLERAPRIQGVTLDARRTPPRTWLPGLAELGATHAAVIPFAFQRHAGDPALRTNYDADWYTEGQAGIRALAQQADSLGMHLVIKPQVWLRGSWSAEIDFATEAAWAAWEARYRDYALYYARLSAAIGAPLFVIGTELALAVRTREAFWRSLIAEIRTVYDGELTYAANWYDDAEHVPFWDALDYVGVQAYFPISEADDPGIDTLRAGWKPHKEILRALHTRTGKPVLFTEIGYRDVSFAAARPWEWPERRALAAETDEALQARLYTAFFEEVWPEPWFAGAILWKWYPPSGRSHAGDFTPQGKQAEAVIREAFRSGGAEARESGSTPD
ncbi:MAG: glycoside hydrolase [Bacteroidota bacterium]